MKLHIVNHSELACEWNWLAGCYYDPCLDWSHASSLAWPALARWPAGKTLARLRAAARAVALASATPSLLVSHGPRPAMYASLLAGSWLRETPHLAFSFNFTELPSMPRRKLMALALQRVDRFTVFSTMERDLYARVFDLDPARIDILHWAVQPYRKEQLARPVADEHYLCAVGSQGRDYHVLIEAMRRLPACRLHLVAYPENLVGLSIPDNVTVHSGVPFDFAAALVAHADAMVLPLLGAEVPCGHVTAVMAMHLGVPVIATDSVGLHDYLRHGDTAILFPAGDSDALRQDIQAFLDDPARLAACAGRARIFAQDYCVEARTVEYFQRYVQSRFGFTPRAI